MPYGTAAGPLILSHRLQPPDMTPSSRLHTAAASRDGGRERRGCVCRLIASFPFALWSAPATWGIDDGTR